MNDKISEKLSPENQKKIEKMVLEKPIQAIQELRNLTGCTITDGKTWVNEKREKIWEENLPLCPYCGEKLRTPVAKQCRFCKRDWHDENELKWLE
ncbi:hypothetical protein BH20ACI4_BH20ACI4_26540 [soil metagenome]